MVHTAWSNYLQLDRQREIWIIFQVLILTLLVCIRFSIGRQVSPHPSVRLLHCSSGD